VANVVAIITGERGLREIVRPLTAVGVNCAVLDWEELRKGGRAYIRFLPEIWKLVRANPDAVVFTDMSSVFLGLILLATKVHETSDRLARIEGEVLRARQVIELTKRRLELDQKELGRIMAESKNLVAGLRDRVEQIQYEISTIRPFSVCPVVGAVAIADDFGIMVHHPPKQGGDHIHQGNDMLAPMGAPIVAPFDGEAVEASNHIGGMAVEVFGEFGYVYNAHLSAFGQLGTVEAGDVIGYVGATGNAGGPHDHFEWHPDNGKAVDPHEFLLMVCDSGALPY